MGAALLRGGRLLAGCRADPPELAGWWELPGGKVEPGEDEITALRRECREELGIDVCPLRRLGGDWPIADGVVLHVWTAQTADDVPPQPIRHRELRWLAVHELYDVAWLPPDLPIIGEIAAHMRRTAVGTAT